MASIQFSETLGLISTYKEKQLTVPLYKAVVSIWNIPGSIQAWRPYRKKDIDR